MLPPYVRTQHSSGSYCCSYINIRFSPNLNAVCEICSLFGRFPSMDFFTYSDSPSHFKDKCLANWSLVYVGHGRIRELVGMVYGETGPMRMKWNTKYILAIKKCQNNHSSNTQYIKSSTKDDIQVNLT